MTHVAKSSVLFEAVSKARQPPDLVAERALNWSYRRTTGLRLCAASTPDRCLGGSDGAY